MQNVQNVSARQNATSSAKPKQAEYYLTCRVKKTSLLNLKHKIAQTTPKLKYNYKKQKTRTCKYKRIKLITTYKAIYCVK